MLYALFTLQIAEGAVLSPGSEMIQLLSLHQNDVGYFSLLGEIATSSLFPPTLVAVAEDKPLPQPGLWPEVNPDPNYVERTDN